MTNGNKTQLGYFIDCDLWQDALTLLNFQIKQKSKNRHFNTLSMFYYENLNIDCLGYSEKEYFDVRISSSLFYGLKKEFSVLSYVIPKPGLGLRDYKFFTYPMRAAYYSVGLYLLKLSQEFLTETHNKIDSINAFYGGYLHYEAEKLTLTPNNVYFRGFHQKFRSIINQETKTKIENQEKVILSLDIQNYFDELSIPKLLDLLTHYIKPSIQSKLVYDIFTREQIIYMFQFISGGKSGIPQADNNIISSFIGYLYLVFGDLFIDDILVGYSDFLDSHKIIRYTDDIYVSITFKQNIDKENQGQLVHSIASQIAEILYVKLGLKLNLKTRLYRLSEEDEKKDLLKKIRKVSANDAPFSFDFDFDFTLEEIEPDVEEGELVLETPQGKSDKIFAELLKIKKSRVEDYFVGGSSAQQEILQEVFDKSVEQILNKPENKDKIKYIFEGFNFDLVKVRPLEILVILLKNNEATDNFRDFCQSKQTVTTSDADLIVKFLCQTGFHDRELFHKLRFNFHMKKIVEVFLDQQMNCNKPGYYNLTCMQMKKLSEMPDVIEQTRLRILNDLVHLTQLH